MICSNGGYKAFFSANNLGYRINSFNKNVSRTYYMSDTILGTQDTSVNKREKILVPPGACILVKTGVLRTI